jgi:hypothetical protein
MALWNAETPSPSAYCASDLGQTFTVAPESFTRCHTGVWPVLTVVEGVVGTQEFFLPELLELPACGIRLCCDPDPELARQRPVLAFHAREHAQRHELIVGGEVLLLKTREILRPLPIPSPVCGAPEA